MNTKSTHLPLYERAYVLLLKMIEDGRIRPGERLMEVQVATAFSISRSPARAALQRLLDEQRVEDDGRPGFRVVGAVGRNYADVGTLATLEPVRIGLPARWESLYDAVEQDLLVQMLYGSVRINELQLAQYHGVSRTVTRDLLARMHGNGLITKDHAGHWIAEQITPDRIRHLYEMRQLLEPAALAHAAPRVPAALLTAARNRLTAALAKPHVQSSEFDRVEVDLHVELLSYCPNTEILGALAKTQVLFAPTRHLLHPYLTLPSPQIRDALNEHLATIDQLAAGEVSGAAATLRQHLVDGANRWMLRFEVTSKSSMVERPPYLSAR